MAPRAEGGSDAASATAATPPRPPPALSRTGFWLQIAASLALIAAEVALMDHVRRDAHAYFARGENAYATTSWEFPLAASSLYLAGVVWLGRRFFDSREPLQIDGFMMAYNAYQTAFNVWAVAGILSEVHRRGLPFAGTWYKPGLEEERLGFLIYAHYQNKFLELLDTVFMVVRKKRDQVSFLHVWHHTIIMWSWLMVMWVNPGGDAYFGSLLNSVIVRRPGSPREEARVGRRRN